EGRVVIREHGFAAGEAQVVGPGVHGDVVRVEAVDLHVAGGVGDGDVAARRMHVARANGAAGGGEGHAFIAADGALEGEVAGGGGGVHVTGGMDAVAVHLRPHQGHVARELDGAAAEAVAEVDGGLGRESQTHLAATVAVEQDVGRGDGEGARGGFGGVALD